MLFMLCIFILLSLFMGGISKVPIVIVFLLTCTFALFTLKGAKLEQRIKILSQGAGESNLLYMIWIFVLAGAFAATARGMGAVDAIVNLTVNNLPAEMLLPGVFLAAAIISICIGTSVGTVVALVPIATGMCEESGISLPMMIAAVTGGAFFGDNLSFISDTTIVATRSQGCKMSDKFKTNFAIALPAAIITFALYAYISYGTTAVAEATNAPESSAEGSWWTLLPYLWVLAAALLGANVLIVLAVGTALCGTIGMLLGRYNLEGFVTEICNGIGGMGELIIVSLLAGGLLAIIREQGGISWLIEIISKKIKSPRGAKLSLALLVGLTNICTANNTIAILSIGELARNLGERYQIEGRRTASILDTFSCVVQGIIPYGAQLLIAGGLAGIAASSIIPYLFYPFILGACAIAAILFGKSGR